ncbi:mast cell protease 3-like [Phacochoerus africanus]|uniref:mast cell protease 3-like n=1 Tax=Phacochoerus africanus TaxID=41426 RepID=UPI001FDA30AD|nr:mast cell protease 3-like [Phacochoerus africanus]
MFLLLLLVALLPSPPGEAGKIIGGHEVTPHSRPYMAYFEFKTSGRTSVCGGFLVSTNFVLTAAHCWGSSIKLTLGGHNIRKKEETQQVIPVKNAICHPDYDNESYANDIMLLQLMWAAKLGPAVGVLKLPRYRELVMPGTVCSVAGWGRLSVNSPLATTLRETDVQVQRDEQCSGRFKYNSTTQICAGSPIKMNNSFLGDSGGPLVCQGVAQGIVSFGKKDGSPPNVYTKISSFLPWIKKTMRNHTQQGPD